MNGNASQSRSDGGRAAKVTEAVREALERMLGMLAPQPQPVPVRIRDGLRRRA